KINKTIKTKVDQRVTKSEKLPVEEDISFEEKLNQRFQRKTITQFKCLDWSTVPTSEMKRLETKAEMPKNLLIQSQL
ncbi:unnamed protein product, partial [Heterobilharzia americana]